MISNLLLNSEVDRWAVAEKNSASATSLSNPFIPMLTSLSDRMCEDVTGIPCPCPFSCPKGGWTFSGPKGGCLKEKFPLALLPLPNGEILDPLIPDLLLFFKFISWLSLISFFQDSLLFDFSLIFIAFNMSFVFFSFSSIISILLFRSLIRASLETRDLCNLV